MRQHPQFNVTRFDSPSEMGQWMQANRSRLRQQGGADKHWSEGDTLDDSITKAIKGDSTHIAEAMALQSKLALPVNTEMLADEPSVVGAYPVVPEYLIGEPECMRLPTVTADEGAPVRIYVSLSCSAGIPSHVMRQRGITALALASAVASRRPCDLYVFTELDGNRDKTGSDDRYSLVCCRIELQNMVLTQAAYPLTHIGFGRECCYSIGAAEHGFTGGWPFYKGAKHHDIRSKAHMDITRRYLELDEADVLIPSAYLEDQMVRDPMAWLDRQIKEILKDRE